MHETLLALCLGVALAAACGFRIFVPFLVISIAVRAGHVNLAPSFAWIGSDVALLLFITATVLEIAAYYVPWLDNLLDSIATPAAVVAGSIATASMITNMSPMMTWATAIIAGGGAAGVVQSTTVVTRATSSVTTGGLANFLVATVEVVSSVVLSIFALLLPIIVGLSVAVVLVMLVVWLSMRTKPAAPITTTPTTPTPLPPPANAA